MMGKSIEAAKAALEAHQTALGIEGDTEIQVWHLLLSLMCLCCAENIDFAENVQDATRHWEVEP